MQLDCILEYRERREKSIFCNAIFNGRVHFLCTKVSFKKAFIKKIASNIQKVLDSYYYVLGKDALI